MRGKRAWPALLLISTRKQCEADPNSVVQLLDSGVIPQLPKVGRHRRVAHSAIVAYKRRRDAEKATALGELAALSQAHRMGY